MTRTKVIRVDRIGARGEDGRPVTIELWQEFIESAALGRDPEWLPSLLNYRLADGRTVTKLDDGRFKLTETGETLT